LFNILIVDSEFRPSWWLSNPHLQTILASKLFKPANVNSIRRRIELEDGDFIDINVSTRSSGPLVALFHGLAGCVDSSYIQGVFGTLEKAGFRPMLMHWRGCSGEPEYSGQAIYAVGYSLGGNALLKHLGESGSRCKLAGAMAVCPPLVLAEGAKKLNTGFAKTYQRYLLALMRSHHEKKRVAYPQLDLPVADKTLNNFWKFDDAITAPLHGYDGVHDYYARCSARAFLSDIAVPAHIVCAKDDPFFTPDVIPEASELANNTTLELSHTGGHVGFLCASSTQPRWIDARVASVMQHFASETDAQTTRRAFP